MRLLKLYLNFIFINSFFSLVFRLFYKAQYFGSDDEIGRVSMPLVGVDVSQVGDANKDDHTRVHMLHFTPSKGGKSFESIQKKIESTVAQGREPLALEFVLKIYDVSPEVEY